MNAKDQGYHDFYSMIDDNPFEPGTDSYCEWSEGHCEAMNDSYNAEQIK